jgi:hypothetical protein
MGAAEHQAVLVAVSPSYLCCCDGLVWWCVSSWCGRVSAAVLAQLCIPALQ